MTTVCLRSIISPPNPITPVVTFQQSTNTAIHGFIAQLDVTWVLMRPPVFYYESVPVRTDLSYDLRSRFSVG
ncbi:hypothetical protein T265_12361 [Opisthorchis viverrini]|uniref:Uncharacterized protein n=1 Tax=Opisthorchis viverrini TaxID=6198 RepID=A0A074YTL8_OPIVI|nr:hypothetical protein T265_12361 [Opisthorchis viverrini]KER18136.1 hypothetical protein T265_12361 [Opisthorchis viverrini]